MSKLKRLVLNSHVTYLIQCKMLCYAIYFCFYKRYNKNIYNYYLFLSMFKNRIYTINYILKFVFLAIFYNSSNSFDNRIIFI